MTEGGAPRIDGPAERLRIYVGESDTVQGRGLWHAILRLARKEGLAGATALRAIEGYGASSRIHTAGFLDLSSDLPIVVEIVDARERIAHFLPMLQELVEDGMITREAVEVVHYGARPRAGHRRGDPADRPRSSPDEHHP